MITRWRRAARRLGNRIEPKAAILLYHRVADVVADTNMLCVTPKHFEEHLSVLRRYFRPTSLQELVETAQDGRVPRRAVVVTFDDGYVDNLHDARPLLDRYDIPGTVFVTTGYVGRASEPWWDELERLMLRPGVLSETLRLQINGVSHVWELAETARYDEDAFRRYHGWTILSNDDPTPRHRAYRALLELLRNETEGERRKALDTLAAKAEITQPVRSSYRILSGDELIRMVDGDLVAAGAHTVNHPVLSRLPMLDQRAEIEGSKVWLEETLGRPVASFAYPFGTKADYTEESVACVQQAGFDNACSNIAGVVSRDSDRFQLPRLAVLDGDGDVFAARLMSWFR